MAVQFTYVPIATNTVSGTSTTVATFSSIPSTYQDLVVVINGTIVGSADAVMTLNNDTGTNYSNTRVYGNGSSASSDRATGTSNFSVSIGFMNDQTVTLVNLMNYANTSTYKSALARINKATGYVDASAILWRNTSAINRVDITAPSGYFSAGTTFSIYGLAAA
jgi:hypothetical protein